MSGYSEASRAALKRVNVTAGQEKILAFLRARPNLKPTRGEITDLTRIPINVVTARVNELINDFERPLLRELPVRNGAHPLELIEYTQGATRSCESINGTASLAAARSAPDLSEKPAPEPVRPYIPGRWSMSLECAKKIAKDPANAFIEEARKVIATGAHWVR